MKRGLVMLGAAAAAAAIAALAGFRGSGRMDAELASVLFAAPVQVRLAADQPLPAASAEPRDIDASRRVLRIDGGDAGFGRIVDVARSGDTLYVLDAMAKSVAAFDTDGRWLFGFGGEGGGPGEFREPVAVMVLPWSGEVAVWDVATQRLAMHTPAGKETRGLVPAGGADDLVHRLEAVDDGFVAELRSNPLQVGRDAQRGMLVTLDTAGRVTGTLLRFPLAGVSASHRESASGRSSVTTWLKPPTWSPEPRWDALPDGTVVFAPGGPDEAYRVDGSGRAVRFHRPMRAAGVTRQDRFRHLDGLRQRRMIASPSTSLRVLEPLNRRFYAAVRPSVTGVLAGPAGAVWTRGFDTRESWRGFSRVWNVAGDAGGLRRVRLPGAFEPLQAQGGVVYGVSTDSLQVERLEAYRVEER
jgi:hypothetical protein